MSTRRLTYTEFLDRAPMSRFHWLLVAGVAVAQVLDGFDYQSTSFALPSLTHEFHLNPAAAGAVGSATNIGLLVGALLFSVLSDRVGRRPIFVTVLATYALGTFLSAVAPSYPALLAARVVAGLGIGAEFPIAFALLAEYSPARLRHVLIPLGPCCYGAGFVLAGLLSAALIPALGWRSVYWVGIAPALLVLYVRRYIPESIRFLVARRRLAEAARVAEHVLTATRTRDVELVPPEAQPAVGLGLGRRMSLLRASAAAVVALSLLYFCYYIQSFAILTWLPTIFVRQGFTLVRSFDYTVIILVATPLSMLLAAWLQDRIDRRYALLLLTVLGGAFFLAFGLSFEFRLPLAVTVGSQFLQGLFGSGVVAILYTLGTELFTTDVRSLGMGVVTAVGRLGAIAGPSVLGILLTFGTAIHQIIYWFTLPLLVAALLALVLIRVDPRQKTLERVIDDMQAAEAVPTTRATPEGGD